MLHELLLCLLGYTGDLIIDVGEHPEPVQPAVFEDDDPPLTIACPFKIAPDVSFIDPSERSAIERLVPLGFYYRELSRFATESRDLSWISPGWKSQDPSLKGGAKRPSVYRRAIANGIVEVLSVYRSAVLQVEQKLLSDPLPILATVTRGLHKFDLLLLPLYELIMEVEREDIRGGQLLSLLHKRCHCGLPELQTCIQRLALFHCAPTEFIYGTCTQVLDANLFKVMYNQLASWMVYGILQDQYGEFFIRRQEDRDVENESSHAEVSEKSRTKYPDGASLTDWHSGFHIFLDMLPEYIHMHVAESILFAGKAIRVLRNPGPAFKSQDVIAHQPSATDSYQVEGFMEFLTSLKEPSMDTELLPQSEANKIDAMLQELKDSSEFHKRSFESAIDSIRIIAAKHLWQLVVVRADLTGHLKALKDYFLLAKGDFFQCFLEESRQLMRLPPRQATAEADLVVPFQMAAIKTVGDEDKYFSRVSVRMPSFGVAITRSQNDVPKAKAGADGIFNSELSPDGWDGIALEYVVDWPLQLFFTQDVLSKYRRVFQYLIRLKRTQMELERTWATVMHQGHSDFAKQRKNRSKHSFSQHHRRRSRPMWHIREHMAFLVRNLQFYIQVDVIESQWNVLQARLQESHDFTELVGFHQEYMLALISQSFLDIGSVSRILDGILKLCLQFCRKMEDCENTANISELEHTAEEFHKKSNSLYTILHSNRLVGSQRAPSLRRFLLRLNFNSFLEGTVKGGLNVVRSRPPLPHLRR